VDPGIQRNTEREKAIHSVGEPSQEKKRTREKETHRMLSWNRNIPEPQVENPLKASPRKDLDLDDETRKRELRDREKKNTFDNLTKPSSQSKTLRDLNPAHKTSTILGNRRSLSKDKLSYNTSYMGTALYVLAALLIVGWAIGFFFYDAGASIHALLVLALGAVLIRVVQGRPD
jgi:hypothetical protein